VLIERRLRRRRYGRPIWIAEVVRSKAPAQVNAPVRPRVSATTLHEIVRKLPGRCVHQSGPPDNARGRLTVEAGRPSSARDAAHAKISPVMAPLNISRTSRPCPVPAPGGLFAKSQIRHLTERTRYYRTASTCIFFGQRSAKQVLLAALRNRWPPPARHRRAHAGPCRLKCPPLIVPRQNVEVNCASFWMTDEWKSPFPCSEQRVRFATAAYHAGLRKVIDGTFPRTTPARGVPQGNHT